jgi:hypothetical protein
MHEPFGLDTVAESSMVSPGVIGAMPGPVTSASLSSYVM